MKCDVSVVTVVTYKYFYIFRLPVPTLVTYNKTSYKSDDEILHETDIGPEVTHIYQVNITKHLLPMIN